MYEIELANQQDHLEIDTDFLIGVAQRTLSEEQVRRADISIALVDNAAIWELNRQFLGHDYPTDVLSFLLEEEPGPAELPEELGASGLPRGARRALGGEVILSTEMALQTAIQYHWSPRDEVVLYLVHGLLHLCGYDDLTEQELQIMRTREREILRHWNLLPHYTLSVEHDRRLSSATEVTGVDP
jgi:probable rRNA maturation factor